MNSIEDKEEINNYGSENSFADDILYHAVYQVTEQKHWKKKVFVKQVTIDLSLFPTNTEVVLMSNLDQNATFVGPNMSIKLICL